MDGCRGLSNNPGGIYLRRHRKDNRTEKKGTSDMAGASEPIRELASARGGETAQQEYRRYGIEQLQETMDRAVNAMDEANEWTRSLPMVPSDLRPLITDMTAKLRVLRDELSNLRAS